MHAWLAALEDTAQHGAPSRVAWLQSALADTTHQTKSTGAWSARLAAHASPQQTAEQLYTLAESLRTEQGVLTSKISTQMSIASDAVQEAAHRAEQLAQDAAPLRDALARTNAVYQAITPAPSTPEAAALASLHMLAHAKDRMLHARAVLQAAESWSRVEPEMQAHLAENDWERAAQRLDGMEQTLQNFDPASEYVTSRRVLLAQMLETLDRAVAPALAEADLETVLRCASVYASVHRPDWFLRHYIAARTSPLQVAWADATAHKPPQEAVSILIANLAQLAQEETRLAPRIVAHPQRQVAALLGAAVDTLSPSLATYIAHDVPLPTIVDIVAHVDEAMSTISVACTPCDAPALDDEQCTRALNAIAPPLPWSTCLTSAFKPYEDAYAEKETQHLQSVFAHGASAFAAQRDRILVATSDSAPDTWARAVDSTAKLIAAQHKEVANLRDAAAQRMRILTKGTQAHALHDAVHNALYLPLVHRVAETVHPLRERYERHAQSIAPTPDALLVEDRDPIQDWDLVYAGLRVLDAARTLGEDVGGDDVAESTRAAQRLVLALLLSHFWQQLDAYAHTAPRIEESSQEVHIPLFSKSPSECMVKLGEGLLNLPRLLESVVARELPTFQYAMDALPYAHDDSVSETVRKSKPSRALSISVLDTDTRPEGYSAEHVLSVWLRSLTCTLVRALQDEIVPRMVRTLHCDRAQLAADVEYMSTIASALNASSPQLLALAAELDTGKRRNGASV
ncbi:hypothetical protein MVES1_001442 [Malassezia vespertilionis]|uniref:Conserved oligomeric Golgi complex subunit 7 n=1 Tax=Malassezia vespertilionis TaxID=2020962 RepID=A0A2N1JEW7_9BASI|nr:uncharacterized protein MVES1_001442 [Malassezia vespertilionis]PKI85093.1 hypothetical protein MVES_001359 [Malassezia vespertilionis]WFD06101.1 hypothetical protein MVES1_001442 [Malassezia vespertilionis]